MGATLLRRATVLAAATTLGLLATGGAANAASFTVTTTNDSNDGACTPSLCSLRDAVVAADAAGGASTISVSAGTYKLTRPSTASNDPTNGDLDINNNASVTITGAGSGSTIIDANQIDRAFAVQNGAGLSLSGLTIENGNASSLVPSLGDPGGAIYSDGALALTADVALRGNFAANGGGAVYSDHGTGSSLTLTGATFARNGVATFQDGGAIYDNSPGSMSVSKSLFRDNYTQSGIGGALFGGSAAGPMTIDQTTLSDNRSLSDGGAIYWDDNVSVSITNSSFDGNSGADGGAIYDDLSSSMTLSNDSFTHNSATSGSEGGGAVVLNATASTQYTLNQDVFDGNTAGSADGGAVLWLLGQLTSIGSTFINNSASAGGAFALQNGFGHPQFMLVNATISDNTASGTGGGIYVQFSTPATLTNDTIAYNATGSGQGGGIDDASLFRLTSGSQIGNGVENTAVAKNSGGDCDTSDTFTSTFDQGHNLDGDSSCFGGTGAPADQRGVDPKLSGPADNGGPVAGDPNTGQQRILTYAEQAGSPMIDAGTNNGCPSTDARGVARPQGAACDIGAFEAAAASLSVSDSAPSTGTTGNPFTYTITVGDNGPGHSTGTTLVDQLPAGETLYGATPSQGSCTSTGSPAKVTCDLGVIDNGSNATVSLVVTEANAGSVTDTATATNDQGANVSGSATTNLVAPVAPAGATGPNASTGGHAHVHRHSAKVKGRVSNGNQPTWYFFQYGGSRKLGSVSGLVRITSTENVSAKIHHLLAGKKYFYRLVAINDSGKSFGKIHSFRTKR
jgi:CSLREA domain-containing protein/uncharacterized repeat protein (TIGR01451 family)